jgi:hypothetical protein
VSAEHMTQCKKRMSARGSIEQLFRQDRPPFSSRTRSRRCTPNRTGCIWDMTGRCCAAHLVGRSHTHTISHFSRTMLQRSGQARDSLGTKSLLTACRGGISYVA